MCGALGKYYEKNHHGYEHKLREAGPARHPAIISNNGQRIHYSEAFQSDKNPDVLSMPLRLEPKNLWETLAYPYDVPMPDFLAFESLIGSDGTRIGIQRWSRTQSAITFDRVLTTPEAYRVHVALEMEGKRWAECTLTEEIKGQRTTTSVQAEGLIEEEDLIPTTLEYFMVRDAEASLLRATPGETSASHSENHPSFHYHVFEEHDPHALSQEGTIYQLEVGIWEVEREGDFAATYRFHDGALQEITYPWAHAQVLSNDEGITAWKALAKHEL